MATDFASVPGTFRTDFWSRANKGESCSADFGNWEQDQFLKYLISHERWKTECIRISGRENIPSY